MSKDKVPCPRCGKHKVPEHVPGCEYCWDEMKWSNVSFAEVEIADNGQVSVHLPEWWRVPEGHVLMFWFRNCPVDEVDTDPLEPLVAIPEEGGGVKGDPESESQEKTVIGQNLDLDSPCPRCPQCYRPVPMGRKDKPCEKCFLEELVGVFGRRAQE